MTGTIRLLRLNSFLSYDQFIALQNNLIKNFKENTLIIAEHPPVITLGRRAHASCIGISSIYPIHKVDRGGLITYHGPGQICLYPIINLKPLKSNVLAWYSNQLQNMIQDACSIKGPSEFHQEGVYVKDKKVGFIGFSVKHWITGFGISLNVTAKCKEGFKNIIPCGDPNIKVGCLQDFYQVDYEEMEALLIRSFEKTFALSCLEY